MINQILVDLDDVCNHFTMTALSMLLGRRVAESEFPVWVGYDLPGAYNVLNDAEDITPDEFWPMVTPDIWSYMPKRHDTEWLLDLCADCVGRENVLICTKSLRHPMHITNKVQWMFANLPHWIQDQYSITSVKHAYARHDVLLIDDSAENTDKFEATRNGRAILVPRPWNRHYRLHPNIYIEERLKDAMMCV